MAEKLRNMTAVYLFREGKLLMLYRVGSRVVAPSWCCLLYTSDAADE